MGAGGVGDLDLVFCGLYLCVKHGANETCFQFSSLINWFGRDVYYGSTNAFLFCISQHKIHRRFTQWKKGGYMWVLAIRDYHIWKRFIVIVTIIVMRFLKILFKRKGKTI